MRALLLRLEGPLQSWGYRSRFSNRDTGLEPTKSGVVGLLCCALGRDRSESPADLAALRMHVRVDKPGTLLNDFHTAGGGIFRGARGYFAPTSSGQPGKNPIVKQSVYLQDASFLVALEGDDDDIAAIANSVQDPVWPLSLGRRSCPPSQPVFEGIVDGDAETAIRDWPFRVPALHSRLALPFDSSTKTLRLVIECARGRTEGQPRRDVPIAWHDSLTREYAVRFVKEDRIEKVPEVTP